MEPDKKTAPRHSLVCLEKRRRTKTNLDSSQASVGLECSVDVIHIQYHHLSWDDLDRTWRKQVSAGSMCVAGVAEMHMASLEDLDRGGKASGVGMIAPRYSAGPR